MKRAGILVATILLALALAGCGASSEEQGSEEQTPAQEAEDNEVTILGADGSRVDVPRSSKIEVAHAVWDAVAVRLR